MFVCAECGSLAEVMGVCSRDGAPMHTNEADPFLGTSIGHFRIAARIGKGGMGTVYRAVHPEIGGRVAVKLLEQRFVHHKMTVDRFFAEARAVNLIRHEKIVNVIDLGRLDDQRPYIVMEYLDGEPLSTLMKKRLPLATLARFVAEVLDAVHAAHQKGVIHRDLKPDNVFVSPGEHAKVLDFGVAKLAPELDTRDGVTNQGAIVGTPAYMSPEQGLGGDVDARSDLYSIGVILYRAVTAVLPFRATATYALIKQHVEETPAPPTSLRADCPPALEAVILRAMAKDRSQRFADASEMSRALLASVQGLPAIERGSLFAAPTWEEAAPRSAAFSADVVRPDMPSQASPPTSASASPGPIAIRLPVTQAPSFVALSAAGRAQAPLSAPTEVPRSRLPLYLAGALVLLAPAAAITILAATGPASTAPSKDGTAAATKKEPATAATKNHEKKAKPSGEEVPSGVEGAEVVVLARGDVAAEHRPPKHLDLVEWLPHARALATRFAPEVELVSFGAQIHPDGRVHFDSLDDTTMFAFRPAGSAANGSSVPCTSIAVQVDLENVTLSSTPLPSCRFLARDVPRCTMHAVVDRAEALAKVPVFVTYAAVNKPQWTVGSVFEKHVVFDDDCPKGSSP